MFRVCHAFCLFIVALWSPAGLLALLCVMGYFGIFVNFPFGVLGQVWYLIVSIPDICLLTYFNASQYLFIKMKLRLL